MAVFSLQAGESCKFWKEVGNKSLLLSSFLELSWGFPPFVPAGLQHNERQAQVALHSTLYLFKQKRDLLQEHCDSHRISRRAEGPGRGVLQPEMTPKIRMVWWDQTCG